MSLLLIGLATPARAAKLPAVVVTGAPVAPSPDLPGSGICIASRLSLNPATDFPQSPATFIGGMNAFMEETSGPPRFTQVLRSPLDLTNNNTGGTQASRGDFSSAEPGCTSYGCLFHIIADGDAFTSFGSRLRAFLNVTPDMVGKVLHFGFYADDALSFVIFDNNQARYTVINRPPQLGIPTWRTTNSVTFMHSGLYPVEILYAEIAEHAALEMSILQEGTFADSERPANQPPIERLSDKGFEIIPPTKFFQTDIGRPAFPDDLAKCQQCDRQFVNQPGNGGCEPGYHCNGAALCAPCNTSRVCGLGCSPCGQSTPHCININGSFTCVECSEDSQCPNGRCDLTTNTCKGCNEDSDCPVGDACDLPTYTCVDCLQDSQCPEGKVCAVELKECRECNFDADCPRGEFCSNHDCAPCTTNDSCAGSSCNCCPGGTQCATPTPGAPPSCVECTDDSQCTDGKTCDIANGRCVDRLPRCNTSDRCGPQCVRCPSERPLCLDGQVCVECRNDLECGDGQFCLSGQCASCTRDQHCGSRCTACGKDAPFCLTNGTAAGSACVACRTNSDCGGAGQCDPATHTCQGGGTCEASCEEGTVCNGSACVECFADAHCPCGGTCDVDRGICSTACNDSGNCLGVQYCSAATQECERGHRRPGTDPTGGSFCCGMTEGLTPAGSGAALALLAAGLFLLRPRRSP